ncbi:hypothetical protein C0993_012791 [Termitomyces sp. T159_Od127]|nr:hypothetical protein C0993_012791 [Termitomyces sp. T159_Od127]
MTEALIDNTSEHLYAPDWVTIPTGHGTLGGSVSRANNTKDLTSFNFTFNGSIVEIYVVVSPFDPPNLLSNITISLDNEELSADVASLIEERNESRLQTTAKLLRAVAMDGFHLMSVTNFPPHYSLDYITVFKSRNAFGELIIQDDDDHSIDYTGQWVSGPSDFDISHFPLPSSGNYDHILSHPYSATTHRVQSITPSVKTSATYHFFGSSVFVYGILEGSHTGNTSLTVAYTLNGSKTKRTYFPGSVRQPHFLWFGCPVLAFDSYTLQIDVLEVNGVEFVLDYIVYQFGPPTFSNSHSLGKLSPPFSSGLGITEKPDWTLPNATNAATWGYTKSSNDQVSKSTIIGASIGGAVGALLLIVAVLLFWLRYRTRRKKGRISRDRNQDGRLPFSM